MIPRLPRYIVCLSPLITANALTTWSCFYNELLLPLRWGSTVKMFHLLQKEKRWQTGRVRLCREKTSCTGILEFTRAEHLTFMLSWPNIWRCPSARKCLVSSTGPTISGQPSVTHSCFGGQVAALLNLQGLCQFLPTVMSAPVQACLTCSVPGCCLSHWALPVIMYIWLAFKY